MTHFQIAIEEPIEIRPRLGKPELHWKEGRSAYELAHAWMMAGTIPKAAREVLDQAPEWRGARLLEAIFERQTALPGLGGASQTDMLGIVALSAENAILGIEGKVDEPFGSIVTDWLEGEEPGRLSEQRSPEERERRKRNRRARRDGLCATLQVTPEAVSELYYQLLHRTCAVVYEARRFRYSRAVMLVHSFAASGSGSVRPAGFEEFSAFAHAVGMPVLQLGQLSVPKHCGDVELRLGWISDQPSKSHGIAPK